MSNFAFIRAAWPEVFESCVKAEANLAFDPRAACFYARRAAELITDRIYKAARLPLSPDHSFNSRTNAPAFRREVSDSISSKLRVLRMIGNDAVHKPTRLTKVDSRQLLNELFHVIIWSAQRYTALDVPLNSQFSEKLAGQVAPMRREDVAELLRKRAQDDGEQAQKLATAQDELAQARAAAKDAAATHAAEIADRDAAHAAELDTVRRELEKVRAAQAVRAAADTHDYREAETRTLLINRLLAEAGWSAEHNNLIEEREVSGMPVTAGHSQGNGYVDYVVSGADGIPVGVVEAKRTSRSAQDGEHQATLYADCLEAETGRRPLIFYTNGIETWIKDDAAGYPARQIQGFYTPDETELAIKRRGTGIAARRALEHEDINGEIAGRSYQTRAIRAVDQAFDRQRRAALLVMATGSGKTRTTIALVDQLSKANWVRRTLFLADRTALVKQAGKAFSSHLPDATTVNLVGHRSSGNGNVDTSGRVYLSTYPTMMNLIQAGAFTPGFFDLVVIDEAHRSVYAKYRFIFEYFDALLLGLTATPKDQVDHNTYSLFNLPDGEPTDAFTLDEAVEGGYLVPPSGRRVETLYLRDGIRFADLSPEEQAQWELEDWGEETPDIVTVPELNKYLFNADTVDKVLQRLMEEGHRIEDGEYLAKTIIFAKNQRHAEFVAERFRVGWPELGPDFAQVITHSVDYAQDRIDRFSDPEKSAPQIAISVDMLDTGIDVPEVANLVFFKDVHSETKFWQMIGRGTRLCPDLYGPGRDKEDFLVFDFCGNLDYFGQKLPMANESAARSLTERITERRLALLQALDEKAASGLITDADRELRRDTAQELFTLVDGMNPDNVIVRPHRRAIERYSDQAFWDEESLTPEDMEGVLGLAGLPSTGGVAVDKDTDAKRFDLVMLTAQLARETGDASALERVGEKTRAVATELLTMVTIPTVREQAAVLEAVASEDWWVDVTSVMLEEIRLKLRGLLSLIQKSVRNPVYLNFEDEIRATENVEVGLGGYEGLGGAGTLNVEKLRNRARSYLAEHSENLVLQRLQRGSQLTQSDLDELEKMLEDMISEGASGANDEEQVDRVIGEAADSAGGLGLFIRSIIGLDRATVSERFATFLDGSAWSVNQIRFIETIIDELTTNGVVEVSRLFEDPYRDIIPAPMDPETGFDMGSLVEIRTILSDFKDSAVVA